MWTVLARKIKKKGTLDLKGVIMKKWIILIILVSIPIILSANYWELKEGLTIWGLPKNITFANDQLGYFSAGSSAATAS